jgi:Na+-translocating ferredoxin:NAD+ oxidoreductase RnfD subunit
MRHAYNGYYRLCFFGLGMAVYYDSPWWVWVIGALCAVKVAYITKD